jgi:hypothetical protein
LYTTLLLPPLPASSMSDRPVLLEDEPHLQRSASDEQDEQHKGLEMKQHSDRYDQLESLRVDDSQLVGNLTYDQLTLYEKKSVLVSSAPRYRLCSRLLFADPRV